MCHFARAWKGKQRKIREEQQKRAPSGSRGGGVGETFSEREAVGQQRAGMRRAAAAATVLLVPLAELQQAHGHDLAQMPSEDVRAQLLARGRSEAALKGPAGVRAP